MIKPRSHMYFRLAVFLACAISEAAFAQLAGYPGEKSFEIPFTDRAPKIDGDISDDAWSNAVFIDDLWQREPVEYREPSQRTEIYVMYDEDALYVGVYAHDSNPDGITNNVLDPGAGLRDDDRISLIIDPFNSQRGGYQFQVNPNGMRSEAIYLNGSRPSFEWEGIWNAGGKLTGDGWTAEMEIPFKSLSFDPDNDTWGINFLRVLQRSQERMSWFSLNGESNPTSSGKVTGITRASQGIGLDLAPALSGIYFKDHVLDRSESDLEPSLDLFYKITPQVNLAVTLNTDFSATEADDNALNLSQFRRFFEEKRAFFLNDFDAFKYGVNDLQLNGVKSGNNALAFYSRRIGLSDAGQPVDILGGVKLSGRLGQTEFGTLVMRQDEHLVESDTGTEVINPTSVIVARVSQPVFGESKIGAIFTDGNPTENQSNSLYGVDFQYRDTEFYQGKSLDAVALYQQSDDPDFDGDQASYTAAVSIDANQGWVGGVQYFAIEKNYSPGLGFTQRSNTELVSANLEHSWVLDGARFFQELSTGLDVARWSDLDSGDLDSEDLEWTIIGFESLRGDEFSLSATTSEERVDVGENPTGDLGISIPAGIYRDDYLSLVYEGPQHLGLRGDFQFVHGDYFTGKNTRIYPSVEWQANKHIELSAGYDFTQYDMPEGKIYTREITAELNLSFNANVNFTSKIEYNNVRRELAFNNRLRWNFEPGQDLWVVFNQGRVDEDGDNSFAVEDTSAALKLVYTLRY